MAKRPHVAENALLPEGYEIYRKEIIEMIHDTQKTVYSLFGNEMLGLKRKRSRKKKCELTHG
jgi:hypothetical protein